MFVTLPWPIASAALLLAVVLSFPFAYLFELGGGTIWAPALLHFIIQGAIKIAVVSGESGMTLPLVWMAAAAAVDSWFSCFTRSCWHRLPAAPLT